FARSLHCPCSSQEAWTPSAIHRRPDTLDPGAGFGSAGIGAQVDLFVFDGSPQALDEDIVAPGRLAIHTDLDLAGGEHLDEVDGRELAALSVLKISGVP